MVDKDVVLMIIEKFIADLEKASMETIEKSVSPAYEAPSAMAMGYAEGLKTAAKELARLIEVIKSKDDGT